jgi:galactoside O-acetyltransferase
MGFDLKKFLFVTLRIKKYQLLSTCKRVTGKPVLFHPLLLKGLGQITLGSGFQNGVIRSAHFYSHYNYFEARNEHSKIVIGNNVSFSNAISIVAFSTITIGDNVIIGGNCSLLDSDGHNPDPARRLEDHPDAVPITVEDNVLIYSNVIIAKGVRIGKNSIIGAGSIVTRNIPENVIAAGNPARVIKSLI